MRRRYWKPKWDGHVRGWGQTGVRHSAPFAKRNRARRAERQFVIADKRSYLQ